MEAYIDSVIAGIQTYDLNSPFTFVLMAIGIMFLMQKWGMLLLTLATVTIGKLGTDLIIWNLSNDQEIMRLPMAVYIAGGIVIGLVSIVSFTKYSID